MTKKHDEVCEMKDGYLSCDCPRIGPKPRKIEVFQDPGNHYWFISIDGLMDTDAGYFKTMADAIAKAEGR